MSLSLSTTIFLISSPACTAPILTSVPCACHMEVCWLRAAYPQFLATVLPLLPHSLASLSKTCTAQHGHLHLLCWPHAQADQRTSLEPPPTLCMSCWQAAKHGLTWTFVHTANVKQHNAGQLACVLARQSSSTAVSTCLMWYSSNTRLATVQPHTHSISAPASQP